MTPLDAMLTGPRPRLDGARTTGDPIRPDAGPGFNAVLGRLESRERPARAAPPDAPTEPNQEPDEAPRAGAPRPASLGALLAGALPGSPARPGDTDLADLMERAAGRAPVQTGPGTASGGGIASATQLPATGMSSAVAGEDAALSATPSDLLDPAAREVLPHHQARLRAASAAAAESSDGASDGESEAPDSAPVSIPADGAALAALPWPARTDAAFPLPPATGAPAFAPPSQAFGAAAGPGATAASAPLPAVVVVAQETHFAPIAPPVLAARAVGQGAEPSVTSPAGPLSASPSMTGVASRPQPAGDRPAGAGLPGLPIPGSADTAGGATPPMNAVAAQAATQQTVGRPARTDTSGPSAPRAGTGSSVSGRTAAAGGGVSLAGDPEPMRPGAVDPTTRSSGPEAASLEAKSAEVKSVSEARLLPEAKSAQEIKPSHTIEAVAPATPGERRAEDSAGGLFAPAPAAGPAPAPAALPAATLRQIADAVATGAASLPDPASVRAGAVAAAWSAAAQAEGPVRLLTLQLRPAELGQVQVRMRLQDGRLEMTLRAEREETAELLRRDGGLLSALVREAGYQPDLVTVQASRLPGQPEASPGTTPGGQALPSFGGQQQGGASPDQPARRIPDAPEEGGRRSMEQRDDAHSGDRGRGGLYL